MTQPDTPVPPPAAALACPHCFKPVAVGPADVGQTLNCPHCDGEFTIPAYAAGLAGAVPPSNGKDHPLPQSHEPPAEGFYVVDDTGERAQLAAHKRDELDGMHIRSVAHLRRAAIRSRSYMLIGGIACLVGAIQLLWWAVEFVIKQHAFGAKQTMYAVGAAGLLWLALVCHRRAAAYLRESEKSELEEPTAPPDFGPLNDGGQYSKNLDKL